MMKIYTYPTPNGIKPLLALEELGLSYNLERIDLLKGEQFEIEYKKINPHCKIPTLYDQDGLYGEEMIITESSAILLYLAKKYGQFFPFNKKTEIKAYQWLFFQAANPAPNRVYYFKYFVKERNQQIIDHYFQEARRFFAVLEEQLYQNEFVCDEYSIVDMSLYPTVATFQKIDFDFQEFPSIYSWFNVISNRPAIQQAMNNIKIS